MTKAVLTALFTALGIFLAHLFSVSAAAYVPPDADFMTRFTAPFRTMDSVSLLCLEGAFVAFLMALFCRFGCGTAHGAPRRGAWRRLLETAFSVNVLIVGAILVAFFAHGSGWTTIDDMTYRALGTLLLVALLEAVVGVVLAILLAFQPKSKTFYYPALSAHLAEVVLLGVITFKGL